MSIILIGYRGSGKTTVARQLAGRLSCSFVDTDELIVKMAGQAIRDIFAIQGESAFRALESAALVDALKISSAIISTGGGVVTIEANRQLLRDSGRPVVYLAAPPEVLCERIHTDATTGENRPALTSLGGGLDEIRSVLAVRDPLYCSVATLVVDATQPVDEVVEEILRSLPQRSPA